MSITFLRIDTQAALGVARLTLQQDENDLRPEHIETCREWIRNAEALLDELITEVNASLERERQARHAHARQSIGIPLFAGMTAD